MNYKVYEIHVYCKVYEKYKVCKVFMFVRIFFQTIDLYRNSEDFDQKAQMLSLSVKIPFLIGRYNSDVYDMLI